MSERYFASIRIGGDLPRKQVARLCALLGLDGTSDEDLLQRVDQGWLRHEDGQAAWGEFGDIEAACRKLGLSYVRDSDGYFDMPAQTAFWRPGMRGTETVTTDSNGDQLVGADVLIEVRDRLLAGKAGEALQCLCGHIVEVPEVPPFRIVARAPRRKPG